MDEKEVKNFHLKMRNLKQTELQRLKNRERNAEDRSENDRARRRTKKVQQGKRKVVRNRRPPVTAPGHSLKI